MFDISFPELIVVGAIALVVLGPERLPTAARTAGLWLGKIKRTVANVQQEITSQLETEELQRKMKSQQDRFEQGLKKARDDIESVGDDPSASSKKLSDRALAGDRIAEPQSGTSDLRPGQDPVPDAEASTGPLSDRHQHTADPASAPAPASETDAGEQKKPETAPAGTPESDSHDRDKDNLDR